VEPALKADITNWLIVFCIYLVPTVVAFLRRCKSGMGIFALNILLGWTFLFWVVSLCWALVGEPVKKERAERRRRHGRR